MVRGVRQPGASGERGGCGRTLKRGPKPPTQHLLRRMLLGGMGLSAPSQARQQGWVLPLSIIAGLVLVLSTMALTSRSTQGFLSIVFQGVNREARDVAESAITDFGVTMNREENRLLLVAGKDETWTDEKHRNPCTTSTEQADGSWSAVSTDLKAAKASTATRFTPSDDWQPLRTGDATRNFRVMKVEYRYEAPGGTRTEYAYGDKNLNYAGDPSQDPDKTVRASALEGGTRTLLRVTIQGQVLRDGQVSTAQITREFEIVPKCCKRSFGKNIGAVAWGRDSVDCPVKQDSGVGNGLIGSLDGGSPDSSKNQLDIRDESGKLITQAQCWAGNLAGKPTDLDGEPNDDCLDGDQTLGASSETKAGVSFVPTEFSLKLPDAGIIFDDGGRLGNSSSALTTVDLNNKYPSAPFGSWIADGTQRWMKLFEQEWFAFNLATVARPWVTSTSNNYEGRKSCSGGNKTLIASASHGLDVSLETNLYLMSVSGSLSSGQYSILSPCTTTGTFFVSSNVDTIKSDGILYWMSGSSAVSPRSFGNCMTGVLDMSLCRWENNRSPQRPYPQVLPGGGGVAIARATPDYSSATRIYLEPKTLIMMQKIGTADPVPMTNCIVSKQPSAPYAVADCRFKNISSGNRDIVVDTSYAMINFHFDDPDYSGEYMGGSGNTRFVRVHCPRADWTSSCSDEVSWTDFQIKCDPAAAVVASRDPNCATANPKYDQSELWNVFTLGEGSFVMKGGSGVAGANIYAPKASVTLKGGGNPNVIDFMGRIWTDAITLVGNVSLRVPSTQAAFCTTACPGGTKVPLYDVQARSFSHASGF